MVKKCKSVGGHAPRKALATLLKQEMKTKPKYAIGTIVSRIFEEEDGSGEERPFEGMIVGFDREHKLYFVRYEDGDAEELEEKEVSKYVLERKYATGTVLSKDFLDDSGKLRPFEGKIVSYDSVAELYKVSYEEDGDVEELNETEVGQVFKSQPSYLLVNGINMIN